MGLIEKLTGAWDKLKNLLSKALPTPKMPSHTESIQFESF